MTLLSMTPRIAATLPLPPTTLRIAATLLLLLTPDDSEDSSDFALWSSVHCPVPVRVSVLVLFVPCEREGEV